MRAVVVRLVLPSLALAAIVVATVVITARSPSPAQSAAPESASSHLASTSALDEPKNETPHALLGVAPVAQPAAAPSILPVPRPASLGGGKPVPPETTAVARRLGLVPEELADVADAHGGRLLPTTIRQLDDAFAKGVAAGIRVGVQAPLEDFMGSRFANQLVRIDREMRHSPPGTKLEDVVQAVTRDTLSDLTRTVGANVAEPAGRELAQLKPLS